jgi:mRNA interferase MazF
MPSELGAFAFGDVVLVPFPFTSQALSKQRPAVIVSSNSYNRTKPDVILLAITSQFRPGPTLGEVWIAEWQAASLLKPSVIKPVFATMEQILVIRRLGTLANADQATLREAIGQILG